MSKVYSVKEMYLTIQGEGGQTGLPAVFLRFAGCNLWNGLESGRASAVCQFCDTDFVGTDGPGGGKFAAPDALATAVAALWPKDAANRWVVVTGGEPLLQLDTALIDALHALDFKIAVETNGTVIAPQGIDWLCVSPKAGAPVIQTSGHELKLVYPQAENTPEDFADMDFARFSLQPRDVSAESVFSVEGNKNDKRIDDSAKTNAAHIQAAVAYCLKNPKWCLSIQTHKMIGID